MPAVIIIVAGAARHGLVVKNSAYLKQKPRLSLGLRLGHGYGSAFGIGRTTSWAGARVGLGPELGLGPGRTNTYMRKNCNTSFPHLRCHITLQCDSCTHVRRTVLITSVVVKSCVGTCVVAYTRQCFFWHDPDNMWSVHEFFEKYEHKKAVSSCETHRQKNGFTSDPCIVFVVSSRVDLDCSPLLAPMHLQYLKRELLQFRLKTCFRNRVPSVCQAVLCVFDFGVQ